VVSPHVSSMPVAPVLGSAVGVAEKDESQIARWDA
jgi:hypothetical protein